MSSEQELYFFYRNPDDLKQGYAAEYFRGKDGLDKKYPSIIKLNFSGGQRPKKQIDLLIAEDGFNDMLRLLAAAQACPGLNTIALCYGREMLNALIEDLGDHPKLMTLDFELKSLQELKKESLDSTKTQYMKLKESASWSTTVIIGVSNYTRSELAQDLLDTIHRHNDSSFQKSDMLWNILPEILWDALGRYGNRCRIDALETSAKILKKKPFVNIASRKSIDVVGISGEFESVLREADNAVQHRDMAVLLTGETGTGKEVIAKYIHNDNGPFVAVNCAAFPENLIESELFGYKKGAHSEAKKDFKGAFERAHNGTLFLDEIAEIKPHLQVKLLRALQEKEFLPLGSEKTVKVDVRLIAATNVDLVERMREGRFREDLFYRLNGFPIHLPPLRQHRKDIPVLARHFVEKFSLEKDIKPPPDFEPGVMELLLEQDYPGNVRQLENIIKRSCADCDQKIITKENILKAIKSDPNVGMAPAQSQAHRGDLSEKKHSRDGLDPVRAKIDVDEELISEGKTSADRGRVMFPDSSHPTQSLGNFYSHGEAARVFDNTDEKEARQRWPHVIQDLLTKRKKSLKNYPEWLKNPALHR